MLITYLRTVTTTIHRYTTNMPTEVTSAPPVTTFRNTTSEYPGSGNDSSIVPTSVPTFATLECPAAGQFSSACKCWASVTAHNTTAPAPTRTATTTIWHNVACGPAATGVFPGNGTYFPCSRQWGMCSCLKSGNDDVCVRVGPLVSNGWQNMTGPCAEFDECDVDESCPGEQVCVYDGSCRCGKKRCYRAAPRGCEYQDLPIDEWESKLHQRRDGIGK
jgi:hypothetical protein